MGGSFKGKFLSLLGLLVSVVSLFLSAYPLEVITRELVEAVVIEVCDFEVLAKNSLISSWKSSRSFSFTHIAEELSKTKRKIVMNCK